VGPAAKAIGVKGLRGRATGTAYGPGGKVHSRSPGVEREAKPGRRERGVLDGKEEAKRMGTVDWER
jgi:hypothetical protein